MKKTISVILVVVLLLTIAATCLAAGHTHNYRRVSTTVKNTWSNEHSVAGCHHCPYAHNHYTARVYVRYECSCGAAYTEEYNDPYNDYCPYSH